MKFEKDHLCSACEQGKIHRKHHKSKTGFASYKPLYLLHIDLCGPMRVESINGKRYVLVVVDDYSRKSSTSSRRVRTDNGTEFKNKTLAKFFDEVGITQQFSAARSPQKNGFVERRNRTLVEAARTMLTFANLPSFLWAEAIATACFIQNRASHGQNPPPAYQAPAYQAPIYQVPVHQPQIPQQQVVTTNEFTNFMKANNAILKNMKTNMNSLTNSNLELKNMFGQFMKMNTASFLSLGTLPGNTITNPKEELKGITTRSGTAYRGPMIPTTASSLPPVVERETKVTKDTMHPTNNGSTKDVQPPVVQTKSLILNSEPIVAPIIEPVASPVSVLKPNQRPLIPYPSRLHDQKIHDKANDQREKFFQIFKDLNINISFADALILMPKFRPSIKSLLTNKDKLFLGFSDVIVSGNATPYYAPIVSTTSPTLTPFRNSDFLLKEVDAFLALENDPTLPEVDQSYVDTEGGILLLEAFLNDDPSLSPPNQGIYLPQVRKELKICKARIDKSSIEEPPEVELRTYLTISNTNFWKVAISFQS
uniref:Integrase catalytic domain-containing protein n=1 Tax=Tanacetum cinerariifolium TaxID=118510 RepID=A0A6L2MEF5_TANCI|nr:hypothetical protein [Tanacetum cinerariifolium]